MTSVVRFPVVAGIYGVSQLATKLMAMEADALIGPWHVGNWVDYTHQVIRIRFNSFGDGQAAKHHCTA